MRWVTHLGARLGFRERLYSSGQLAAAAEAAGVSVRCARQCVGPRRDSDTRSARAGVVGGAASPRGQGDVSGTPLDVSVARAYLPHPRHGCGPLRSARAPNAPVGGHGLDGENRPGTVPRVGLPSQRVRVGPLVCVHPSSSSRLRASAAFHSRIRLRASGVNQIPPPFTSPVRSAAGQELPPNPITTAGVFLRSSSVARRDRIDDLNGPSLHRIPSVLASDTWLA